MDDDELIRTTVPHRIEHRISGAPDGRLVLEFRFAWSEESFRRGLVGKALVAMSPQEALEVAKDIEGMAKMVLQQNPRSTETH